MIEQNAVTTQQPDTQLTEKEKFYEQLGNIGKETNEGMETQSDEKRAEEVIDTNSESIVSDDDMDDSNRINDDPNTHLIPRTRLNKELEKRKALEAEIAREREEKIKAKTELELYTKALEKSFNLQRKDAEQDLEQFSPLDEDAHKVYTEYYKSSQEAIQKVQRQQAEFMAQQALNAQEMQFKAKHEDFNEACDYLINLQTKVNQTLGVDEQQAKNITLNNLRNMATDLLAKGKNVPEAFYNIAQEYGFKSKSSKGPNLDAISENMKKSKTAEVNSVPVNISAGGSHLTSLKDFDKYYTGKNSKEKSENFHKLVEQLRKNK